MRRAANGTTTTGATAMTAMNHHIAMRGAGLNLTDKSRSLFGEYNMRNPTEAEALRLDALRVIEITATEARARHAAKPPKIKKGKKNRKPKK